MWIAGINGVVINEVISYNDILIGENGSTISMVNETNTKEYNFRFTGIPISFKTTIESYYLHLVDDVAYNNDLKFYENNYIFTNEATQYIKWMKKQAEGLVDQNRLKHFLIAGIDLVFEIIDYEYPTIEIIEPN